MGLRRIGADPVDILQDLDQEFSAPPISATIGGLLSRVSFFTCSIRNAHRIRTMTFNDDRRLPEMGRRIVE